jgi:hypothetical protein
MDLQSEIMLAILSEMTPTTTYSDRGSKAAEKCTAITIEKMGEFAEWVNNNCAHIKGNKYKYYNNKNWVDKTTEQLITIFLNQKQ